MLQSKKKKRKLAKKKLKSKKKKIVCETLQNLILFFLLKFFSPICLRVFFLSQERRDFALHNLHDLLNSLLSVVRMQARVSNCRCISSAEPALPQPPSPPVTQHAHDRHLVLLLLLHHTSPRGRAAGLRRDDEQRRPIPARDAPVGGPRRGAGPVSGQHVSRYISTGFTHWAVGSVSSAVRFGATLKCNKFRMRTAVTSSLIKVYLTQ